MTVDAPVGLVPVPERWYGAVAGAVSAGLAVGLTELIAGIFGEAKSPVVVLGDYLIGMFPSAVERFAIRTFGTNDKAVLIAGIVVLSIAFGALLGVAARRSLTWAVVGFAAFAALPVLVVIGDSTASVTETAISVAVGAAIGILALRFLLDVAPVAQAGIGPDERAADRRDALVGGPSDDRAGEVVDGWDRRRFVRLTVFVAGVGAVAAVTGRWLAEATDTAIGRASNLLPARLRAAKPPPSATDFEVSGLTPYVTPEDTFYRIDTALIAPRVNVADWRLRVTGMVDRPLELSFEELLDLGLTKHWTTLTCVSNEVGGDLVGNALWGGVPLRTVLDTAGVRTGATQVVGRSVDGWTAGFPTEAAFDGRAAMVAVSMNGQPLPVNHGFPARLVVPGLYGYVSATKWLTEIELATFDDFDAYWIPRGWDKLGPIKTQSRIDVPSFGSTVSTGRVQVAGVAWAQERGISKVEVRVDDGPWNEARLAEVVNDDTWRQWLWTWDAKPGDRTLQVRAFDGEGTPQTAELAPPAPSGATGYHTVDLTVKS
ncbi:MAG: molybdopterin-dependent oxidoreductase [Microthrixaceae bacterium]